jgi:hypothetical protein
MAMANGSLIFGENPKLTTHMSKDQCYSILNAVEMEQLLIDRKRSVLNYDCTLNDGALRVYRFADGVHLILPESIYPDPVPPPGFLCPTANCYLELVATEQLPLNSPMIDYCESDVARLLTINSNIEAYRAFLAANLSAPPPAIDRSDLATLWPKVWRAIRSKRNTAPAGYFVAYAVVVSELVRLEKNGRWLLQKKYGVYNPYWKPLVIGEDDTVYNVFSRLQGTDFRRQTLEEFLWHLYFFTGNTKVADLKIYENRERFKWL